MLNLELCMEMNTLTILMFQERICVRSFIKYCQESKLFMSMWSVCHIEIICCWPASRLSRERNARKHEITGLIVNNWGVITCNTTELLDHIWGDYLDTLSTASLLTGGTMKQTEGTVASWPERFRTFHLKGWELLRSAHSSPLCTVIWNTTQNYYVTLGCDWWHNNCGKAVSLTSCCLKSQTAWTGNLPLIAVVGLRGFSWMTDFALLFRLFTRVLNSFSCSFSSWGWINSSYYYFDIFIKHMYRPAE